jgi:CRISPR-associated protein Cmr4
MQQKNLYIFTRTPLHVGAGSSVGAIDQPIQRERHTGFPIIPGSSIKGVLRDHFSRKPETKDSVGDLFGKGNGSGEEEFEAGKIAFSEARLLAFPVRSAKGSFAFATSVLALCRLARDAGLSLDVPEAPDDMHCLAGDTVIIERNSKKAVVLEEYKFVVDGTFPDAWQKILSSLLNDAVLRGAGGRFVLLSDGDLSHFAMNACQVNQHVCIDNETGTAKKLALFNEETVPSETLFYGVLTALPRGSTDNPVFTALASEQLIQFGGNSTTGLGFCTVKLL